MKKTTQQLVYREDCVKGINSRVVPGSVNLAIFDSPYNQGEPYDAYSDNKSYDEFMKLLKSWLFAAVKALHKHGSMFIFIPDEWVSEVDMYCRHELKLTKRRHIIWTFTFGVACQGNFSRSHCHILYLTKQKTNRTFNDDAIRVKSARALVYKDKRANPKGKLPDATWMLLKEQLELYMTPDTDTWLESRICGTFKARKKHSPNQLPLPLLERIIEACSDPGDLVLDPFVGTGGTAEVCTKLNRNFIGFDISPECVKQTQFRINQSKPTPPKKKK